MSRFDIPELKLNFSPISLSAQQLDAYVLQFKDKETLQELRKQYADSVFHRQGEDVFCVPLKETSKTLGQKRSLPVKDNLGLVSRLIREALIRHFADTGATFANLSPIRILDTSVDLANAAEVQIPNIHLFPEYRLETRIISTGKSPPQLGLTIDVSISTEFSTSIEELSKRINVNGIYVVTKHSETKGRGKVCWNRLQGKIDRIDNHEIVLSDSRDKERVLASECFPEGSKRNQKIIIEQIFGTKANAIIQKLAQQVFGLIGGLGRSSAISNQLKLLNALGAIPCSVGLAFTVSTDTIRIGTDFLELMRVRHPTFVFDPAKEKVSNWHDKGLIEHGPFDSEAFQKKEPKLVVIVPEQYKGEVEQFISSFKNGVPNSYFEKGFIRKYHLTNFGKLDIMSSKIAVENLAESYRDACLLALEKNSYDLAIVVIEERFHDLFGDNNPYLVAKSIFMSQGIPVQEVEIETVRGPGRPFVLNNIGLACYAKLGGIPWTISSLHPVAHELVIGLGSANISAGRLTPAQRYVGITTVFNSDGNYLLSNISREVEFKDYQEELTRSLVQIVSELSKRHAWMKGDTVRLIFHQTFKPFRDVEVQAIKDFVSEITDFETELAFVSIGDDHPFVIFDPRQLGIEDNNPKYRGMWKGEATPERGYLVQIGLNTSLITVTGPRQLLTPYQACPKPLLVSLHKDSTFKDISYITRQVYAFTFLSWRAFNPTSVPVTILYSNLIANLLGQLRHVKHWNPDTLRTKLRYSRWFL